MPGGARATIRRRDFDAAIFDLDGVLTETARLHAAAWKGVFDAFLRSWTDRHSAPFRAFDDIADYRAYVDGRPREDGIRCFLRSRGISLPEDAEQGSSEADSIRALGERKARLFREKLEEGIDPSPGAKQLL
jgi:alpha,alpha-trehalase